MRRLLFLAATFAFVFGAAPLWADVDYPCLNACAATGKASTACLTQCTHDQPAVSSHMRTDYRCVDLCVEGGKPASSCMSRCSYNVATAPATPNQVLSAHDVLQAPVPAGDTILPPHDITSKPESSKDYKCIQQCVRDGMQYQLCNTTNCAAITPEYETTGH